jgi:lipopolysaccharide/colanic/teichoic acid biosynthesis glycosyltransferase
MKHNFYKKFLKRVLDIIISLAAIIVLSPIMLLILVLIKIESKGPAVFKQERICKNGKVFIMRKFRSMCVDAEQYGHWRLFR